MRVIYIACLLLCSIIACKSKSKKAETIEQLRLKKASIDSMITDSSLVIYVKTSGSDKLLKVESKQYPESIETTYNVLKNEDGDILYIAELPFSETSDWFQAYRSYFDEDGKLFAFQRLNNFLKSECTRGAAIEKSTSYYSSKFKRIDSVYTLTDSYNKPLVKTSCKFPYNFPFKIFKDAKSFISERGIN